MDAEKHHQKQNTEPQGCRAAMERGSAAVHRYTERFFEKQTSLVVNHPGWTIGAAVLFTVVMAQGVWFYDEELSSDKQFSPRDSQAVKDESWVVSRFGHDNRNVKIYLETTKATTNMLAKESLLFALDYHNWVISQWKVVEGANVTYDVVCARYTKTDGCKRVVSPLSIWRHNRTLLEEDADPLATLNAADWRAIEPSGAPLASYMGGAVRGPTGFVSARAIRIDYLLKNEKRELSGIGEDDLESRNWEIAVAERSEKRRAQDVSSHGIAAYVQTEAQEEVAGDTAIEADISKLIIGYMMMILYASFVLSRSRPKYSHSVLGVVSVISVGMSTFSAYGFCWYVGVKFNTVVQVLILVLLGVGVDDTFVIMDSWWDCADIIDMKERMISALRHAGPAVTVTSLTDLIAFLAGSSTRLPALKDFCYYATVGILFDFVFQVTLVVAIAYLDSIRQEKSRADILCCVRVEDDTGLCLGDEEKRQQWRESDRGIQNMVVGTWLPRLTLGSAVGKIVVAVVSAVFLAVGIYGCTQLKMNFNGEWFIPDGHSFNDVLDARDRWFGSDTLPANAYFGPIDYPNKQGTVKRASTLLLGDPWVAPNSTSSWLEDMHEWVRSNTTHRVHWDAARSEVVPSEFYRLLKLYASTATGPENGWPHIDNIRWNEAGTALAASRIEFHIVGKVSSDGEAAVDAMDSLRGTLRGVAFPWTFPFIFWESYKVMVPEITRNVAIAGSCVFVLVSVMVANIQLGLLVTLTLGCVDVCILGFMPLVGVELNSVSVICVVLAVGLSVDYSVHIAGAFLRVGCGDNRVYSGRTQRAAYAVKKMGPAVVNGGFSTWLAIAPAMLAVSYVFTVFFRMFSLIIFFGQWFGVFLLPVLLSVAGPDAYLNADSLEDLPSANPLVHDTPDTPVAAGPDTEPAATHDDIV